MLFSLFIRVSRYLYFKGVAKIPGAIPLFAFLFRLTSPKVIAVHDSKMYMNPHDAILLSAAALNSFEPFMTEIFEKELKEGDTVVDLGANIGYYTLLASRLVGKQGKVYAFEPDPKTYNSLIRNIELNKYSNVVAVQKAVTNKVGTAKFFVNDNPEFDTLYQPVNHNTFIEVETETLDRFFQDKDDIISVIKMDIEGGEMDAILEMGRVINQNKNLKLFVEFGPALIKRAGHSPEEFLHKLLSYNFQIYFIDEKGKRLKYISNPAELMEICEHLGGVELLVSRQPLENKAT